MALPYTKVDWVNGSTPENATTLGQMDQGIKDLSDLISTGRLGATAALITDWNAATASGFYRAAGTAANTPVASVALVGIVIVDSSNYLVQIVVAHNDAQTAAPRRWIRTRLAGTWGAWYDLVVVPGGGSIEYENDWAVGTAYEAGDVVRYNGIEYLAVNPSTGETPGAAAVGGYGTSLPGSPVDGQEFTLVDSLTSPAYSWKFRYVAAKATNKWVFIGGAGAWHQVDTSEALTGSWVNLATDGPYVVAPVVGDYLARWGAIGTHPTAGAAITTGVAAGDTNPPTPTPVVSIPGANQQFTTSGETRLLGVAAGTRIKMRYSSGGTGGRWMMRWIEVVPVAVGG
jgi:hypothetical protein